MGALRSLTLAEMSENDDSIMRNERNSDVVATGEHTLGFTALSLFYFISLYSFIFFFLKKISFVELFAHLATRSPSFGIQTNKGLGTRADKPIRVQMRRVGREFSSLPLFLFRFLLGMN